MRNEEILDSWKDISDYLDRNVRTCARWEKELGLPVHRYDKDSPRSKVFAYKSEINDWLIERSNHKEIKKKPFLERRRAIPGLTIAVGLLIAVSAFIYIAKGKFSSANPDNLSIAFLPFESFNFPPYEQYIPEGISKEIIDSISNINGLRVVLATPLAKGSNSNLYLDDIREKFNVNHFLKTKLEKNENKLKIGIQLVNADNDKVVWNLESQDKLENLFTLKEDICLKIHKKLNSNNNATDVGSYNNAKIPNNSAFDSYLKGNHILNRANSEVDDPWKLYIQGKYNQEKWTKESNDLAISFFSKAIELDEYFAKAYIRLGRCYLNYINFNWDYDKKWLSKAEELLKKAASIDSEYSEYYSTLIQVNLIRDLCFDEDTQDKAFDLAQLAIKKYPGCPLLRALLGFCHYLRFEENGNELDFKKALEHNEESYYLRPYHINNIRYAELLMLNREYDKALMACSGIQGGESSLIASFRAGEIYYYRGNLDQSATIFLQLEDVNDFNFSIGSLFHLGMIAAQRGETSKVEKIINKINLVAPREFNLFENKLKLASIYMGIGKKELAYDLLEATFNKDKTNKSKYTYLKYLEIDKNFDNCREEERFKNLIY